MRLEPTERMNLTLSAGAIAASFAVAGPHFASSLALGALFEALNFRALNRTARALFDGEIAGGKPWVTVLAFRLVALVAAIAFAIHAGAHPIGLVLGLSMAMPASVIVALRNRPPVVPAEELESLPPDDPSWDTYSIWRFREVEREEDDEE